VGYQDTTMGTFSRVAPGATDVRVEPACARPIFHFLLRRRRCGCVEREGFVCTSVTILSP
jgi:hypothetical protein